MVAPLADRLAELHLLHQGHINLQEFGWDFLPIFQLDVPALSTNYEPDHIVGMFAQNGYLI